MVVNSLDCYGMVFALLLLRSFFNRHPVEFTVFNAIAGVSSPAAFPFVAVKLSCNEHSGFKSKLVEIIGVFKRLAILNFFVSLLLPYPKHICYASCKYIN